MDELGDLIARVDGATGPSREIDFRIAYQLGWRFNGWNPWAPDDSSPSDEAFARMEGLAGHWHEPGDRFARIDEDPGEDRWDEPPEWSASLDAAITLCERTLPGWFVNLGDLDPTDKRAVATLAATGYPDEPHFHGLAPPRQYAIALLSALLRALQASTPLPAADGGRPAPHSDGGAE
jgi:hypothetical protein